MHRLARLSYYTFLVVASCLVAFVAAQAQVTFSTPASYAVGTNPGQILTGDFNGDGIPDLAVANSGDASVNDQGSVSILLGNGNGTFQPALDVPAGAFPKSLYAADFNNDGKLDLLVLGAAASDTGLWPWSLLLGHGDGTFGAPLQIAVTYPLYGLGIGDFNHDQKLDVIFSDTNTGTQQMRGNGDGTFQSAQPVSPITGGGVVVGDFNGDGKPDVAVGGIGPDGSYQVLLGKGDGTFQALSGVVPGLSGTLFTADLNHDGRTDMIANDVHVLECQGFLFRGNIIDTSIQAFVPDSTGNFHPAQQVASGSYNYCTATGNRVSVAGLGDYDGDGNEDVVVADSKAGRLFYAGNGDGTFASNPASISGFPGLPAADLNGDKLADGVEVLSSSTIGVVLNTTQGFWLGAPASFGPLRAGGSATATISVNPQNGFTEPVSLTCSAPQSAGIQCSLSSLSITPGGNSTLTVTTTGNSASSRFPTGRSHSEWFYALCLPFAATVFGGLGFGSKGDAKRKLSVFAIGGLLLAGIALQAACGGGSSRPSHNPGTPVGTYAITVTGTSGTIAHSTTVQLTVQ